MTSVEAKRFYFIILFGKEDVRSVASPDHLRAILWVFAKLIQDYRSDLTFKLNVEDEKGRSVGSRQAKLTEANIDKAVQLLTRGRFANISAYDNRDYDRLDLFLELHKYWRFDGASFSERTTYVAENSLSLGINVSRFAEPEVDFDQVLGAALTWFDALDGIYGYSEFGCPFGLPSPTDPDRIVNRLLSYAWHEVKEDFRSRKIDIRRKLLGVHWENFLSEGHVRELGGVKALERVCECVKRLDGDRWYTRLTTGLPTEDQLKQKYREAREAWGTILV